MTTPPAAVTALLAALFLLLPFLPSSHSLGSSTATLAVTYGGATTVCGIVAEQTTQQIQCWSDRQPSAFTIDPAVPFSAVAGGLDFFCAVRSGGSSLLCFNFTFAAKRIYYSDSALLTSVTIGDNQVCGLTNGSSSAMCWRDGPSPVQPPIGSAGFGSISSGLGFSCGVIESTNRVVCWGRNTEIASQIQSDFNNMTMMSIYAGGNHACGMNSTGFLICRGSNQNGQLDVPSNLAFEYSGLTLGANHSCAIRRLNRTIVCWGSFSGDFVDGISFESIASGLDFVCGLTTNNFSVICWGPGWNNGSYPAGVALPLQKILPGSCYQNQSSCRCGIYPESEELCSGNGNICRPCDVLGLLPPISPPPSSPPPAVVPASPPSSRTSKGLRKGLLAFAIVGSVGGFAGICTVVYCLWTGVCFGNKKIHNSVQPTITNANNQQPPPSGRSSPVFSRSSTLLRQGSRLMRRQRSGTSSKHTERAEEFTFSDLAAATNNFSLDNKIGGGSFGVVYKGKLPDGREVAIKRGETGVKMKKFQEKESAFDSELAFLSRLHHKHLVRLVGYCEEKDERLLVYEYMKNGALYDHLHDKNNVEKSSSIVNSWKMRIKIALDAARGIDYLHNYAVPPIIHRDIKSSNILLDANWTARVSDFGLSLMGPETTRDFRPTEAAGTVGYIDPEYMGLKLLTAKSDVYGLGVVLLELLTGRRAIFKSDESGGSPTRLVDYAVPVIMAGELQKILDTRVGQPEMKEAEAVELVAYTAMHCVNWEGKERPTMTDIVANLERALALCDDSHGSISSGTISISSD